MQTIDAVKIRILRLCEQRNMSINRLATVCALPPSSIKNILYGKSCNPKLLKLTRVERISVLTGRFSPMLR